MRNFNLISEPSSSSDGAGAEGLSDRKIDVFRHENAILLVSG